MTKTLLLILFSCSNNFLFPSNFNTIFKGVNASTHPCEGVTFMPTVGVVSRARDIPGQKVEKTSSLFQGDYDEEERARGNAGDQYSEIGLVDIHSFNHYYTFQIDRDVNELNEGVVMDVVTDQEIAASSQGFAMRLRTEFNSAEASRAEMAYSVTFGYKKWQMGGYTIEPLAEVSSTNTALGEGVVSIDLPSLPAGRSYQIRYNFYQKSVVRNGVSKSFQEDIRASSDASIKCNLPYFTQELVFADRKVLESRAKAHLASKDTSNAKMLSSNVEMCKFSNLDQNKPRGSNQYYDSEAGFECQSQTFLLDLNNQESKLVEDKFTLRKLGQFPLQVSGEDGQPTIKSFRMTFGSEFAFAGGLRVLVSRADGNILSEYQKVHPFACLLDHSCQLATKQIKNHNSLDVLLTTGEYVLQVWDVSTTEYTDFLVNDLRLQSIPFTVKGESLPVIMNELRDECPFMFLMEDFIQLKYVDQQQGSKFTFSDKIIMDLYSLKQNILIVPELNSVLKVTIRESFGVNANIRLCRARPDTPDLDCFHTGQQVGTTELLYFDNLRKGVTYIVQLDYAHSVLAFHSYEVCPHLELELSLISQSERDTLQKERDQNSIDPKESPKKISALFESMSKGEEVRLTDPDKEGSFTALSKVDSDFQVLYSRPFSTSIKMGLFLEIYYSPFDDEVLELFIQSEGEYKMTNTFSSSTTAAVSESEGDDETDYNDEKQLRKYELNKYKSGKSLWVDLEAGNYVVQILAFKDPHGKKRAKEQGFFEKINFQLYMMYEYVNEPRMAFLPQSLNYYGLLGRLTETQDFTHLSLFYDDLTLWRAEHSTLFEVESDISSAVFSLQQPNDRIKMKLYIDAASSQDQSKFGKKDQEKDVKDWKLVGKFKPQQAPFVHTTTISVAHLIPETKYKLVLERDAFGEGDDLEDVEMGERYALSFSLKIEFSENNDPQIAQKLRQNLQEYMPEFFDDLAKIKYSTQTVKEKAFVMGNAQMMNLMTYGDGYQEMKINPPYLPQNQAMFVSFDTYREVLVSLPFIIEGELQEKISAGIYEMTRGSNALSLTLLDALSHEEITSSITGKHFSLISGVVLPPGEYVLLVKNNSVDKMKNGLPDMPALQFFLDITRNVVPLIEDSTSKFIQSMQLCSAADLPKDLTKPGLVSPLGGNQLHMQFQTNLLELYSGFVIPVKLEEESLVTVYIETASDIPVSLTLSETGGMQRHTAHSKDQDRFQTNFIHQDGFKDRNVAQIRDFVAAGTYWIQSAESQFLDNIFSFDDKEYFCETFQLSIQISPIKNANKIIKTQNSEEEFCEVQVPLTKQFVVGSVQQSRFTKELGTINMDVGYFDLTRDNKEGPFLIYFQLDYDQMQEGVVGVVLSQFDGESNEFMEVGLYSFAEDSSSLVWIVERNIYAISIQTIASTPKKYGVMGPNGVFKSNRPLFFSHCFQAKYTYLVKSIQDADANMSFSYSYGSNIFDQTSQVVVMETLDDLRNIREFASCAHDEYPQNFPVSAEGFEISYAFKMTHAGRVPIDLIIEEPSLVKVQLYPRNSRNKVMAQLVDIENSLKRPDKFNQKPKHSVLASTNPVDLQFTVSLNPERRAYHLVIDQIHVDEQDSCPIFDLKISVKPLIEAIEDLNCSGLEEPPQIIKVTDKIYKLEESYSFSQEFIETQADRKTGIFEYDIVIDLPHSDYLIDIELKQNFLLGSFKMTLFAKSDLSDTNSEWIKIAFGNPLNEESSQDLAGEARQNMLTKVGDKTSIQTLKYVEDAPREVIENASSLMLRLKARTKDVIKAFKEAGLYKDYSTNFCFDFDLSIFADEPDLKHALDSDQNKLMRINWKGKQQSHDRFDISGNVLAFLEFEKSATHIIPKLTSANSYNGLRLIPIENEKDKNKSVVPVKITPMRQNQDVIILTFGAFSLEKGTCYKLSFGTTLPDFMINGKIQNSSKDMTVCTSSCDCDPTGTKKCLEKSATDSVCLCHQFFTGASCSECKAGYFRNEQGFCMEGSACEQDGGSEDCNGHGTCYSIDGQATCECDSGFANDGLSLCGRCADPLMEYPSECGKRRTWLLESDTYQCNELPLDIPRILFSDDQTDQRRQTEHDHSMRTIFQQDNGVLEWAGRYSLLNTAMMADPNWLKSKDKIGDNLRFRKESFSRFIVPSTSVFRLFLNTLDSGVKVSYAIKDSMNNVVQKSQGFETSTVEFGLLKPKHNVRMAKNLPYTLELHYQHQHSKTSDFSQKCPLIEVHFVVEPAFFHQDQLQCSAEELKIAQRSDNRLDEKITLGRENYQFEQKFVIPHSLVKQAKNEETDSIISEIGDHFVKINTHLNVKESGVFSAILATDFSDLFAYMSLRVKGKHELIQIGKQHIMDEVIQNSDTESDVLSTVETSHEDNDHLSSIEIQSLPEGEYELSIRIPRAFWTNPKKINTCLDFTLMMEFIPSTLQDFEDDFGSDSEMSPYKLLSVYPFKKMNMLTTDSLRMELLFDRSINERDLAQNLSDLGRICRLENMAQPNKFLNSQVHEYHGDEAFLLFVFEKDGDRIREYWKDNGRSDESACYQLNCVKPADNPNLRGIKMVGSHKSNNKYCFTNLEQSQYEARQDQKRTQCNPFSKAKKGENGQCLCPYPYTGPTCFECAPDFTPKEKSVKMLGKRLSFPVCVPSNVSSDSLLSNDQNCNENGVYDGQTKVCRCEEGFAGDFCQMCENPASVYPDCSSISADGSDENSSDSIKATLRRLKERVRKEKDQVSSERGNIFEQQCPNTDFPRMLNSITDHKQFASGDFHISDTYTVNHDADNLIDFTPRKEGIFKILVKQPERETAVEASETMHIEIGVAREKGSKFLKTVNNMKVEFGFGKIDTDFAMLSFEITKEIVGQPLFFYFRGKDYKSDYEGKMHPQCTIMFIEMEFRSADTRFVCDSSKNEAKQDLNTIQFGQTLAAQKEEIFKVDVLDKSGSFFYQQDYFASADAQESEQELLISVAQKFIDSDVVLPVIEIVETGIQSDEMQKLAKNTPQTPTCQTQCYIGGIRSYNEFAITSTIPSGTYFRLWLYLLDKKQSLLTPNPETRSQRTCVNYSLSIQSSSVNSEEHDSELQKNLRCEHTHYLPKTFNTERYLRAVDSDLTQKDFYYVENVRIDNLKAATKTRFTLKEDTIVRIEGLEHDNISFKAVIFQNDRPVAVQRKVELGDSKIKINSSLFELLPAGKYVLILKVFSKDSHVLRQPCQSMQLQIAFNRAQEDYLYPRDRDQRLRYDNLSLENFIGQEKLFKSQIQLNQKSEVEEYRMFQILHDDTFRVKYEDDQNLIMKVNSDFLRNDVNFILIHTPTGQHFSPQNILEDSKRLSLANMPSGGYRLIIFSQNLRMNDSIQNKPRLLNQPFTFNFRIFTFNEPRHISIFKHKQQFAMPPAFIAPEQFECISNGRKLPESLTQDVLSQQNDFEMKFAFTGMDLAFKQNHMIEYTPETNEDILHVKVDSGIQIRLFAAKDLESGTNQNVVPLSQSHDRLGNNVQELVMANLNTDRSYMIELVFSDASEMDEYSDVEAVSECTIASLWVKIGDSSIQKSCSQKSQSEIQKLVEAQETNLTLEQADTGEFKSMQMVAVQRKSKNGVKSKVQTPIYSIQIRDENSSDLEIVIDDSELIYGASITLIDKSKQTSKSKDKLMSFGDMFAIDRIEPSSIKSYKHMTRWSFHNLEKGTYAVKMTQPLKPVDCFNLVQVSFRLSPSAVSLLSDPNQPQGLYRFMSKAEDYMGIQKMPLQLPQDLNSFRFLGGTSSEEDYVLFSELIELNDDESQNVFRVKASKDGGSYIRVMIEDMGLRMVLDCSDPATGKSQDQKQFMRFLYADLPDSNDCTISIKDYTKEGAAKRAYLNSRVQVTIMVTSVTFVRDQYSSFHRDGLVGCPGNQFPLALSKSTEINTDSEEQSYYNYPLIRYPQHPGQENNQQEEINKYSFRFNETQRFYFELGSNFISSHAYLQLQPSGESTSTDTIGKQVGNLNIIDIDLSPGDYSLTVNQYSSVDFGCAFYSLKGLLNMYSSMSSANSENSHYGSSLVKGATNCEIKSQEEAPTIIYKSAAQTRKGNEDALDVRGNYFKMFEDLLIVKNHEEVLRPWIHEMTVEVPQTSLLQLLLRQEQADFMTVKVAVRGQTAVKPLATTLTQTSQDEKELKTVFKLVTGKTYIVQIEYAADAFNKQGKEASCAYFDLIVAINTIKSLQKTLDCGQYEDASNRLLAEMPERISERDMDFKMRGMYHLRYPEDFKESSQGNSLVLPLQINSKDSFNVKASLAYDVHIADFQMSLVEFSGDVSDMSNLDADVEFVARSTPIANLENNDDETFVRNLKRLNINPAQDQTENVQYLLTIAESQAQIVFDEVVQSTGQTKNLCLPFILEMDIYKKDDRSLGSYMKEIRQNMASDSSTGEDISPNAPLILNYKYIISGRMANENLMVPVSVKRIQVGVLFSEAPKDVGQFRDAFSLDLVANTQIVTRFKAVNFDFKEANQRGEKLSEVVLSFEIDIGPDDRRKFRSSKDVSLRLNISYPQGIKTEKGNIQFVPTDAVLSKMRNDGVHVKMDGRDQARKELKEKESPLKDTIQRLAKENKLRKQTGKKSLVAETEDNELADETSKMANENPLKFLKDMKKTMDQSKLQQKSVPDFDEDVKCNCVHGTCKFGQSDCEVCDNGWTGKLCDIESKFNPDAFRKAFGKSAQIAEDVEEAEIFESFEDKVEKLKNKAQEKLGKYAPTNENKPKRQIKQINESDDEWSEDVYMPKRPRKVPTKIDEFDEQEEIVEEAVVRRQVQTPTTSSKSNTSSQSSQNQRQTSGSSSHGSNSSYENNQSPSVYSQKDSISASNSFAVNNQKDQGFVAKIFWYFVWFVKNLVYCAVIIALIACFKMCVTRAQDYVQGKKQKKRKGKRKRESDLPLDDVDGMGLSHSDNLNSEAGESGISFSDDGGEDSDSMISQPIEMAVVSRKSAKTKGRQRRSRMRADSSDQQDNDEEGSVQNQGRKLQLFEEKDDQSPIIDSANSTRQNDLSETSQAFGEKYENNQYPPQQKQPDQQQLNGESQVDYYSQQTASQQQQEMHTSGTRQDQQNQPSYNPFDEFDNHQSNDTPQASETAGAYDSSSYSQANSWKQPQNTTSAGTFEANDNDIGQAVSNELGEALDEAVSDDDEFGQFV